MQEHELAAHDERLVAAATGEQQVPPIVVVPTTAASEPFGRRANDIADRVITRIVAEAGSILGIWKDERGYWSTRRILLWTWTGLGFWAIAREIMARVYVVEKTMIHPHFLSNAWIQAWMVTEGAFIVAVFGPVMVDYFKNAAPAMTAIGSALRDRVLDPVVRDPRLPSMFDDERND